MNGGAQFVFQARLALALSYLTALIAVTGCKQSPADRLGPDVPAEGDLIALIGPDRSDPRGPAIAGGARRFIASYPTLRLDTFLPADNTHGTLMRIVDKTLAAEPRVVCLYVTNPALGCSVARKILKHNVAVVTIGLTVDIDQVFGHVHTDEAGAAELLGEHLMQIAAARRSYLFVHRRSASAHDEKCYARFMAKARFHHALTLLEERDAAAFQQPAGAIIRALFARFRHAGLAVTLDPTPWLETPPAQLLGREASFATCGAAPALWPYLKSGQAAALAGPIDGEIGALAAEIALIAMTDERQAGLVRGVQSELVTRASLDHFSRRYAEAAGTALDELVGPPLATEPTTTSAPAQHP